MFIRRSMMFLESVQLETHQQTDWYYIIDKIFINDVCRILSLWVLPWYFTQSLGWGIAQRQQTSRQHSLPSNQWVRKLMLVFHVNMHLFVVDMLWLGVICGVVCLVIISTTTVCLICNRPRRVKDSASGPTFQRQETSWRHQGMLFIVIICFT